jgi:hypothetical protein
MPKECVGANAAAPPHGVEADIAPRVAGMGCKPCVRTRDDAAPLPRGHRLRGVIETAPRLDLDEHEHPAAAGDEVDLADRAAPAARHDAVALHDQQHRRPGLRREPQAERGAALRARSAHR